MKQRNHRSIYYKAMDSVVSLDEDVATGYLAGFGNVDSWGDRLNKGCCAKSIVERGPSSDTARKIAMLAFHNMSLPVGSFTLLQEQQYGLYYEGKLSMVPFVVNTLKPQLESKVINQHSIGFNYIWDEGKSVWNDDETILDIYELDLFEGSFVTLGMNENTPFQGFKKFLDNTDTVRQLELDTKKALKGIKNYKKELELRSLMMKYQSLLDEAAEIITESKKKPPLITKWDFSYLATELSKNKI